MTEKVMYNQLPEGAQYRQGKVTEGSRISIPIPIPKPVPLIGGTEVYQKDNGTEYWYCKIKEGRDEFMHLYFEDLTEEDLLYDAKGKKRKFVTDEQRKFKSDVLKALDSKPEVGFRWIPVYEPSEGDSGIQYVSGAKVLRGLNSYNWEENFKNYSPENGSREASKTTYFLLLLRWLKDGIATIEQLSEESKDIGHYRDSKNAKNDFEKTGEREFGGVYGFVGNTYKEVKDSESRSGFSSLGGSYDCSGAGYPVADGCRISHPNIGNDYSVGLLELTK